MEQTVDFQFAQTELMMNEISSGIFSLCCHVRLSFAKVRTAGRIMTRPVILTMN